MAKIYTKDTWVDEVLSGSERFDIKDNAGAAVDAYADLTNCQITLHTTVTTPGTQVTAARMNNIENGIDGLDTLVDIHGATGKTTPADADELTMVDSAASFARKKLTWANLKAAVNAALTGITGSQLAAAAGITGSQLAAAAGITDAQLQYGKISNRQGGSATDWSISGTNNYTPETVRIQTGSTAWSGGASSTGSGSVTFPAAFPLGAVPMVLIANRYNLGYGLILANISTVSRSGFTYCWRNVMSANETGLVFDWIAIGAAS